MSVVCNLYISVQGFCRDLIHDSEELDVNNFYERLREVMIELGSVMNDSCDDLHNSLSSSVDGVKELGVEFCVRAHAHM